MPILPSPDGSLFGACRKAEDSRADDLWRRFRDIRGATESLCEPLEVEDFVLQSMPDASPVKWHLAHTTWFFETFVLLAGAHEYRPLHPRFGYLFNSYYNAVGERHPRPRRGLLSRPSVPEIFQYRRHVDRAMADLFTAGITAEQASIIELGLHHEQQHQELLLTDVKHAFSLNPLFPVYRKTESSGGARPAAADWIGFRGGVIEIGFDGGGFCFDNERPRHRAYVDDFAIASRPVTNREYQDFIEDGGYARSELWLSDGWDTVQSSGWQAPLYWIEEDGAVQQFALDGLRPLAPDEPVCHVSYYEADAFARWAAARLPTEMEWELACQGVPVEGNLVEQRTFHPRPAGNAAGVRQMFGDVWEWTASPYTAYPGYQPAAGALGEYNGKFMCNQFVLRGGSCATSGSHIRPSYRNFFHPDKRWQFSGIRLARDV